MRLLEAARYEVLPTRGIEAAVLEAVPTSVTLTVTASPAKPLSVTVDQAVRFRQAGYDVVPHLAARMISGRSELTDLVAQLREADIHSIFVPGGDADPVGAYHSSLDLLTDLRDLDHPFTHIGITGYPESHPSIHDDVTIQSMWDKRHVATHIVSNMTFDPRLVVAWVRRLRARGVQLPVLVGVPGPVETAKLVAMGTRIGVGDSLRFLTKQRRTLTRVVRPGYSPERFISVVATASPPDGAIAGLHVFTFNQVAATQAWRRALLERH